MMTSSEVNGPARAVHSSFAPHAYATHEEWQRAVAESDVRLQWDPDHAPSGEPLERRAVQLGLRGDALARYAREWVVGIEDVSDLVREQREHVLAGRFDRLVTPREEVYPVADAGVARRLGVDAFHPAGEVPC